MELSRFFRDIRSGNEEKGFRIVQDGTLRTAMRFNHNLKNKYSLQIRVFDNGAQPLYSDTYGKFILLSSNEISLSENFVVAIEIKYFY